MSSQNQQNFSTTNNQYPISDIERSIFATIAYYDHFNYPLTATEVYQYLIKNPNDQFSNPNQIPNLNDQTNIKNTIQKQREEENIQYRISSIEKQYKRIKPSFYEILEILDNSERLKKFLSQKNGFYFLKGREEIIKERIRKKKLADEKFKKIKWIFKFIYFLPFVRLVMLSGSMGLGNPCKESDIDLLVVARSGRIWTARALITFFVLIFGKYRHTGKTANRLCLNHYITGRSLFIDFGNLYKAEEYLNLAPILGDLKIYKEFFSANRPWLENYVYLNGDLNPETNSFFVEAPPRAGKVKYFFEFIFSGFAGDQFEKWARDLQIFFIRRNPLTEASGQRGDIDKKIHSRVVYNDDNLVFHPVLVEPEIIKEYEEKIKQMASS